MNIRSVLAACRFEIASLVKHFVRVLQWGTLIILCLLPQFVWSPQAGVMPAETAQWRVSAVQAWLFLAMMLVSFLSIGFLAKSQNPERKTWIGIHGGNMALGVTTLAWLPQWSGLTMALVFALFVFTPNALGQIANRRASAGNLRAAAFYAGLIGLFHPSKQVRFQSSFLRAQALASMEAKVAAYHLLAAYATPEQFTLLNCYIALAQDDWEDVLGQIRSGAEMAFALKLLEIRALGELGRGQEMVMTYVRAESDLSSRNRLFCRLFVLAFSGHLEGVRSLLSRQLRFLSPRSKAYWIFIASQAAGVHDDDARRTLASYADATSDETFRRTAQRHLAG
jgi:hypothetical protein